MNNINDFLLNTDLSAKDTIIISVVSALVACFIIFIIASLFKPLINRFNTFIEKKYSKLVLFIKAKIRHSKGILTINEIIELEKKLKNGEPLTKKQMQLYNKAKEAMKPTPEQQEALKKLSNAISNIKVPRI